MYAKGRGKGNKGGQRNSYSAGYGQGHISVKEIERQVTQSLKDRNLLPAPQPKAKAKGKKKKQQQYQGNKMNQARQGIFAPFGRWQGVAPKETYGTRVLPVRSRVTRKVSKLAVATNGTMAEEMFIFWPIRACTSLWVVTSTSTEAGLLRAGDQEGVLTGYEGTGQRVWNQVAAGSTVVVLEDSQLPD